MGQRPIIFKSQGDLCILTVPYVMQGEYNVSSKSVTRDVSQLERTSSEVI